MDGARLQSLVHRGFGLAAARLGLPHDVFRPADLMAPLAPGAQIGEGVPAAFDTGTSYKFTGTARPGDALRFALLDGALVRPGDYLRDPIGLIHFIAEVPHLRPIVAVRCNAVVALRRLAERSGVGAVGYGHDTRAEEATYAAGWPAALTMSGGGGSAEAGIPGQPADPAFALMLPALPGAQDIDTGDVAIDDLGRRFVVVASERGPTGWRATLRHVAGG